MKRPYLLPLLVLSGFAGLAYELLWVRLLALGFGSTTLSFSAVLAAFFGGLALGSRWAGSRVERTLTPVRTYALLELGTGLLALALYPVMKNLGSVFVLLDPGQGPTGALVRLAVSSAILLPPTFLMGATLPFVTSAVVVRGDQVGRGTALVYGINTLGACLGAYAVTFWLIPTLGVFASTLVTVGVNLVVATVALLSTRLVDGDGPAAARESASEFRTHDEVDAKVSLLVNGSAFITGFVAVAAQVVWGRIFSISLGGTVYGIGSVLVAVLLGIAIGSLVAARLSRAGSPFLLVGTVQLAFLSGLTLFSFAIPLADYVAGTMPQSGLQGRLLDHANLLVVFLTLGLATTASGATLPLLVNATEHSAARAGLTLSRLYAVNTVGCILGSVLGGFVLLPALGSAQTTYLLVVILAGANAIFTLILARPQLLRATAVSLAGVLLVLASAQGFDSAKLTAVRPGAPASFWAHIRQEVKAENTGLFLEGDVATVLLRRGEEAGSYGLSLNGLGQGGRRPLPPEYVWESTLVAAVPASHVARPERALVVGLGAGATVKALLEFGVPRVEVVELERGVVDAVGIIWGDESPVRDPRVALHLDDARHFLMRTGASKERFDLIASMPAHPWVAPALFTRDFFEIARASLSTEGVFSTWFGLGQLSDEAVQGLLGAFTAAFPEHIIYYLREASALYLVGGPGTVRFFADRWKAFGATAPFRGIDAALKRPAYLLLAAVASSAAAPAAITLVNTDDNGLVEFGLGAPRKGLSAALEGFPQRFLPLDRSPGADSPTDALALLEEALGTDGATLPAPSRRDVAALARLAEGWRPVLGPAEQAYLDARLALARGDLLKAKAVAATIASPATEARLAPFLAWARPAGERLEALRALPADRADLLAARLSSGDTQVPALAYSADRPLSLAFAPPSAWDAAVPPEQRATVSAALMREVLRFSGPALAVHVREAAAAAGWKELGQLALRQEREARRREVRRLLDQAMEAGARKDFGAALSLYRQANEVDVLPGGALRYYLAAAIGARDSGGVSEARALHLARGVTAEYLEALERTLRASPELLGAKTASPPTQAPP